MKVYSILKIHQKSVDRDTATLDAIFSTADEDRHGDVVEQNWDLINYKRNPVILNSHNYGDATEVIGRAEDVAVIDGKLQGKIIFAVDANPKAKIIFDLYADGFLNAFSVGFMAKKFDDTGRILESELLEVSAVSVPANARALAKQKGIDVDALNNHTKEYELNAEDTTYTGAGTDTGSNSAAAAASTQAPQADEQAAQTKCNDCEAQRGEGEPESQPAPATPAAQPEIKQSNERDLTPSQLVKCAMKLLELEKQKAAARKTLILKTVTDIINTLGEQKNVETPSKTERAEHNRVVNKLVREVLKHKK